jgi:hypothetical protein
MSRLGRSQPIQPAQWHGFVDPGPGPVGTTPARPIVIERERRRELAPYPIFVNGLYAISPPATATPPLPLVVEQESRRWRAIFAPASSGPQALVAAAFALTVTPPKPVFSVDRERARPLVPAAIIQHGFIQAGIPKALSATVNSVATVTAVLVRVRARSAAINGSSAVSATLVRIRARAAVINGVTTVTASVVRTRARAATVNGVTAVSATLTRVRARAAVINGSSAVSLSRIVRTRAFTATTTGTSTVSCVLSVPRVKLLTATINGNSAVSASLVQPQPQPGGGIIIPKRVKIRTVNLRPRHATIHVTAFAPQLTITGVPGIGIVRSRPLAPSPTLIFQASTRTTETLGELPYSKRELIDKLVIYDYV